MRSKQKVETELSAIHDVSSAGKPASILQLPKIPQKSEQNQDISRHTHEQLEDGNYTSNSENVTLPAFNTLRFHRNVNYASNHSTHHAKYFTGSYLKVSTMVGAKASNWPSARPLKSSRPILSKIWPAPKPSFATVAHLSTLQNTTTGQIRIITLQNLSKCLTTTTNNNTVNEDCIIEPRFVYPSETRYLAVSYKWQQSIATSIKVTCPEDNRTWISPHKVLVAIVELATRLGIDLLWMDSLCVDQSCYPDGSSTPSSNEDRARFIPRMSEIFTKAEIVAGYADDSEDAGCTDWYDRLWILQEMVLAKRLMIYRGRWSSLAEERVFWGKKATLKGEEGLLGVRILSELGAACLGVCNGERKLSLAQIARLTAQRQCFCPQDRIYGIFGLLSFKTRIVPDYKDSVDVVWRRLCQEAVTEHGDLSVLLSRCSDFGEGQSILLETAKLPEIAQGLDIDWRNDLVAVEADRWKFTHHVPVSVKVINGVGPASMRSQESTKAVDFLETELMDLITSNSPELSAKLEWVCKSLFVLSKVHEKQRPVGFSVQVQSTISDNFMIDISIRSEALSVREGDALILVLMGSDKRHERGMVFRQKENSDTLIPISYFSTSKGSMDQFPKDTKPICCLEFK